MHAASDTSKTSRQQQNLRSPPPFIGSEASPSSATLPEDGWQLVERKLTSFLAPLVNQTLALENKYTTLVSNATDGPPRLAPVAQPTSYASRLAAPASPNRPAPPPTAAALPARPARDNARQILILRFSSLPDGHPLRKDYPDQPLRLRAYARSLFAPALPETRDLCEVRCLKRGDLHLLLRLPHSAALLRRKLVQDFGAKCLVERDEDVTVVIKMVPEEAEEAAVRSWVEAECGKSKEGAVKGIRPMRVVEGFRSWAVKLWNMNKVSQLVSFGLRRFRDDFVMVERSYSREEREVRWNRRQTYLLRIQKTAGTTFPTPAAAAAAERTAAAMSAPAPRPPTQSTPS
ncbi:hypothetical protein JCM11251_003672, partial [Rhodosporidiobolus azoricus]